MTDHYKRNIVRVLLVGSLFFYLPGIPVLPVRGAALHKIPVAAENGMGGGLNPSIESVFDTEPSQLAEIHEVEEPFYPRILTFSSYTLERGDIIGNIAVRTGLNEDTLISANNIKNSRLLQIGQVIRIPNQDGIFCTAEKGDTLESLAERYETTVSRIMMANEMFSGAIAHNASLFIPGARMNWVERQEINGDLFIWPVRGRVSSGYGFRRSPFTGVRQHHTGIDIAAPSGVPVRAAMSGRVIQVGFDETFGNSVLISHHSGYRTLYAHLNVARVRTGAYVQTGERIGDVGSTGLSTGPHLHFTVYKNGVTVNPGSLMR